jgi:hypothetical protein
MVDTAPAKNPFVGLNLADDLREFETAMPVPRPRPDQAKVAAVSESAGFPSREPRVAKAPPPPRPLNYDARLTIRIAEADKTRFDNLVYRLRTSNGDAFRRLLDHFEASGE